MSLSRSSLRQQPHEGHRGRHLAAVAAREELGELLARRRLAAARCGDRARRARTRPAPCGARAGTASPGCRRAAGRTAASADCRRRRSGCRSGVRNSTQLLLVELLLLVRDVAALARLAQAVALDRLGQDDRRRALVLDGRLVGGVDLHRIVAAAASASGAARRVRCSTMLEQPRIGAEEVLADVGAGLDGVLLILAVDDFAHPLARAGRRVSLASSGSQSRAPDDLDDVPAGAAEGALPVPG